MKNKEEIKTEEKEFKDLDEEIILNEKEKQ